MNSREANEKNNKYNVRKIWRELLNVPACDERLSVITWNINGHNCSTQRHVEQIRKWQPTTLHFRGSHLACKLTNTKKVGEKNKIRDIKGEITRDITEIQRIIGKYFETLYSNHSENLEEMAIFLDNYGMPTLKQQDIETYTDQKLAMREKH